MHLKFGDSVQLVWEGQVFAKAIVVSAMAQAKFVGGGKIGKGFVTVDQVSIINKKVAAQARAWADHKTERVIKGVTSFTDSKVKVQAIQWKVPLAALAVAVKEL